MISGVENITLSLRPRRRTNVGEAWFIMGDLARSWLEVMLVCDVDLEEFEGFVLPRSLKDRAPSGLMVVAGLKADAYWHLPNVHGYRYAGTRLLIPCDADLHPPVSKTEMDAMLHHHLTVMHPAIGLVGFEETDCVRVSDLLGRLPERATNFSWAHPGHIIQERLHAITAMPVPRVEVLFDDIRKEIGSQHGQDLPETPEEAEESGVGHWRKQMRLKFLDALKSLSKGKGVKPAWKQRLEAWTQDRIDALRKDQERELKRLLHLLKTDPDEGLKYALPLTGGQGRGTAPPASKLSKRDTDFTLGNLRGGNPGSPWVIDWQKHYDLSRRYREAANRELRLGRFRRAAYIYAELLKDYRESANVLRQGKHFREASVLYLKHLGDPLEGARCLREGGFLLEAITIFENKKRFETVAELYAELGNESESARFYRLAVSRCVAHGHTVKAATLLERYLGCPEEAIALLQKTWPRANDAGVCLEHELGLYERCGQLELRLRRIEEVTADHPPSRAVGLMEVLVKVARQSLDTASHEVAERSSFTVAGRWLGSPIFRESRAMLALVRRLVPGDRLLTRDTARFAQQSEHEASERARRSQAIASDASVVLLESSPMPSWVQWLVVEPRGRSGFFALGTAAHGVTVMRFQWAGAFQTQMLPSMVPGGALSRCRLSVAEGAHPQMVSVLGVKSLEPAVLTPADAFVTEARVENPPWVWSEGFLGMAYGGSGVAWVLKREGIEEGLLVISSYSSLGDLIATHTIRLPSDAIEESIAAPLPMICAQDQVVFVYGRYLIRFYRDKVETLEMAGSPNRLHYSPIGRLQLAASYDTGAEIFWGDGSWGRTRALDLPVNDPMITFTRTGDVLALSHNRLDLLGYQKNGFVPLHTEPLKGFGEPLGIFPTETPNIYAMVSHSEVRMIRVTPWQLANKS